MIDLKKAVELQRRDARARAIVNSVVARVMAEHGPVDPEHADRHAHEIAHTVAAIMLQQIYEGDAELNALRRERDALQEHYIELSNLTARPLIVRAVMPENEQ